MTVSDLIEILEKIPNPSSTKVCTKDEDGYLVDEVNIDLLNFLNQENQELVIW